MVYIARDKDGNQVNIIEFLPAQVAVWQELTGLTLELPPEPEPIPEPVSVMEEALNELGVNTRE